MIRITAGALVALAFIVAVPAAARPRSSTGQECTSSGTSACTGTDASTGQKLNCAACDYCTFNECKPVGGQIKCFVKTEYSNPRNCTAARSVPKATIMPGGVIPKLQKLQ